MNRKTIRVELVSQFYRKNHCAIFLTILVALLSGLSGAIVSWITKELIDMLSGQSRFTLCQILLMCVSFALFHGFILFLNYISEPAYIRRAMRQYKDKAFCFLSAKNISSFRKETTSAYLSALTNDAASIEADYINSLQPIVTKVVSFFGSLVLMIFVSPALTIFSILIISIPTIVSAVMGKKMAKAQKEVSDRNTAFTATMTDCLSGFQVIKSFQAEKEINRLFVEENGKLEESKYRLRRIGVMTGRLGGIAGMLAQLGVFLFGAYLAKDGSRITAGTVLMFVNLMNFLIPPVADLPKLLASKKAAAGLVDKLADSLSQSTGSVGGAEVEEVHDGISLNNVSFAYEEGGKEILHDINCEFLPGRSYAIVGASGSGKSTFLNLLMAANNEYKGEITIDGCELRDIDPDSLYDLLTVIQQNVFIFNSSIKDNVTMFRDFPEGKIEEAMRKAHLCELIRDRGEEYLCGEGGKGLSGGEKQRISIARSLLKESSVLLADEVTSALDAKTSYEVINEILELDSMTRIVVTHSLEEQVLRRYDEIIVLKDGTIEEKGNFADLMARDGYFKALYTVAG
jgi:ABC-type multidrug transport system fused ATPase/permease subunit